MKSNLNELEKTTFERDGVVFPVWQPSEGSRYLLAPEIVQDCEKRVQIGHLIWKIIRGTESDEDRKYASQNSKMVVSILLKIWDVPGFSRDGVSQDKYYLVNYQHFDEEDNAQLLTNLLTRKRLNVPLVNTILKRPIRSLLPLLNQMLKQAENSGDVSEQLYLAILIEQTAHSRGMLPKLYSLSNSKHLSEQNRNTIRSLINSFEKGKAIVPEDIENLRFAIDEFEENRLNPHFVEGEKKQSPGIKGSR